MIASALGSYPRIGEGAEAQKLRRSIQKFQAGGITREALREVENQVVGEAITEQEAAGLDWLTDGLVRWEDGQTYFSDRLEGFKRGQLIRYFDTNTYYRQPVATGPVRWKAPISVEDWKFAQARTKKPVRPVVTGPYTLARLSENTHYADFDSFAADVATAIHEEVRALEAAGAKAIQIDEPALVQDPADEPLAKRLLARTLAGTKAEIWVALYMGSPAKLLDRALEWAVAGLWLDGVSDGSALVERLASKPAAGSVKLGLGIVDARNTRLESTDQLRETLARVADRQGAERLVATTSAGLEFLPRERAQEKLARLAQAAHTLGAGARS
jgi:5-methyltetrahydropteroyltriglutamate--homocysteine methyltransferase